MDVLGPIMSILLTVGRTIDIKTYEMGRLALPIYNETDIVQNPLNSFNASYYVLPDGTIPYDKVNVPIDYLLQDKIQGADSTKRHTLEGHWLLTSNYEDRALVLVVAEYQTSEEAVKANTNPTPNWQDNIWTSRPQTHYVDKIVHGYQAISIIGVRSGVKGDVHALRKILKEVMGTSGRVTADTVELWKKAEKAIFESPDVRGEVSIGASTHVTHRNRATLNLSGAEAMLKYVSELPKNVDASPDDYYTVQLRVKCKLLHDLDERYPIVRKDEEGERYFIKFYNMLDDLVFTDKEVSFVLSQVAENTWKKLSEFKWKLLDVEYALLGASHDELSLYDYIYKADLREAFEQYEQGLDDSTENYLAQFRKLREQMDTGIKCGEDFLPPTRGTLVVAHSEVFQKGKVFDLEICKSFCVEDERCRSFGYSNTDCLIYYRSSNSATITLPGDESDDIKIYDRVCTFKYKEDYDYY